jgi:hypothetical protein
MMLEWIQGGISQSPVVRKEWESEYSSFGECCPGCLGARSAICVWLAGIIPGILVLALNGVFFLRPQKKLAWLCWLSALLGVWLIVSPFIAGYLIVADVTWANFLPGGLIAILGAATGYMAMRAE